MKSALAGMVGVFCLMLCAIVLDGDYSFLNIPSLVICVFMPLGLAMASAGGSDLGRALRAAFSAPHGRRTLRLGIRRS